MNLPTHWRSFRLGCTHTDGLLPTRTGLFKENEFREPKKALTHTASIVAVVFGRGEASRSSSFCFCSFSLAVFNEFFREKRISCMWIYDACALRDGTRQISFALCQNVCVCEMCWVLYLISFWPYWFILLAFFCLHIFVILLLVFHYTRQFASRHPSVDADRFSWLFIFHFYLYTEICWVSFSSFPEIGISVLFFYPPALQRFPRGSFGLWITWWRWIDGSESLRCLASRQRSPGETDDWKIKLFFFERPRHW